jgi:hypothetical protein
MDNGQLQPRSRRQAISLVLGAGLSQWLPRARAASDEPPVRMAISESLVTDVNMNDARAAMVIWLKRMMADLNVVIEFNPKVFDTTAEILRRARHGEFDTVALNVVEYRQIAEFLDPTQVMVETGAAGPQQYLLLAKRNSGIQQLADLRGRRLIMLRAPKMCVAPAWLSTILDEGKFGQSDRFFSSVTADTKTSRVVLPVFFGQIEACLSSKQGFDTMCELNPQVGKDLTAIASSPAMVVTFSVFHKNFHGATRDKFAKVYSRLGTSAAARQVAMLFQFEDLALKDATCLGPALAVLDKEERGHNSAGAGGQRK